MPLNPPAVTSEPFDPVLSDAFDRAGADWKTPRTVRPEKPGLCMPPAKPSNDAPGKKGQALPNRPVLPLGDRWLAMEFAATVADLANALRVDEGTRRSLSTALHAARYETAAVPTTVTKLLAGGGSARSVVSRTDACPILTAYLQPLLDPVAFPRWLEEMATTQWFYSSPQPHTAVSGVVRALEQRHDRELAQRWVGNPPQVPVVPLTASAGARAQAEAKHDKEVASFDAETRRVRTFLASEPSAFAFTPSGASDKETKALISLAQAASAQRLPVVNFRDGPAPANLFISEAVVQINSYLALLDPLLRRATNGTSLFGPLMGVAYAVLAVAVVPVNCLYDSYHGTCTVENVIPGLLRATATMEDFASRTLVRVVAKQLHGQLRDETDDKKIQELLGAFSKWIRALAAATRGAHLRLLKTVGDQSAGRVPTPVSIAPGGKWQFTIDELQADGSTESVDHEAAEALSYDPRDALNGVQRSARDTDSEIYWMLSTLWPAFGTAVALANQSGVRVWINAANNRWGGHHPPHTSHRQGNSFDVDACVAWKDKKVQNVQKRDENGTPLTDEEAPDNSKNVSCLQYMERIVGWIITQSFVLVGVNQYLYGDAALVEQASLHVSSNFGVVHPSRIGGTIDRDHYNHWHFELGVHNRSNGVDPYVWDVPDDTLLDRLYELAVARDKDRIFWEKFAGLSKVPTEEKDFSELKDRDDWIRWWKRRDEPCGIPLLPVWAPGQASRTYSANQCWSSKDPYYQDIFQSDPDTLTG